MGLGHLADRIKSKPKRTPLAKEGAQFYTRQTYPLSPFKATQNNTPDE